MRVEFTTEGGLAYFPGLSRPVVIESDKLSDAAAVQLRKLIDGAKFFERPAVVGTPAGGAADYHRYTVTIEQGARRHTVEIIEPIRDPALGDLVAFLRACAQSERSSPSSHD